MGEKDLLCLFGYVNIALCCCAQGECTALLGVRGIWRQMLKWPIKIHWGEDTVSP